MGLSWKRNRKLVKEGKEGSIGIYKSVAKVGVLENVLESSGENREDVRSWRFRREKRTGAIHQDHPVRKSSFLQSNQVRVGFDQYKWEYDSSYVGFGVMGFLCWLLLFVVCD